MNQYDIRWVKELAQQALQVHQEISCCEKSIEAALAKDEFWSQYMYPVGPGTLAVLLTTVGDLRKYPNSGALLKALGLNLKERSSGNAKDSLPLPNEVQLWRGVGCSSGQCEQCSGHRSSPGSHAFKTATINTAQ